MSNLTADERAALESCELAVFEDRIIYKACPPIDDATLAAIADKCSGPLPDGLVALWRVAFGGALDAQDGLARVAVIVQSGADAVRGAARLQPR